MDTCFAGNYCKQNAFVSFSGELMSDILLLLLYCFQSFVHHWAYEL